ncbi:MAG: hypothetical protein ACI9OJ_004966, partial [Myxococcota bacterium]
EANPDNSCESCQVLVDDAGWSNDDTGDCDDGDLCTTAERCYDGECIADAAPCDDSNVCTADSCDPETGDCVNTDTDAACDDGDTCTFGDHCVSGVCTPQSTTECDDSDPCTLDVCDDGCTHQPAEGATCDDGKNCTESDICSGGQCAGQAKDCNDNDACTQDGCIEEFGCIVTIIDNLCADDNPCTDVSCDSALGCVFPFNSNSCDDSNACTEGDTCTLGACLGTAVSASDNNPCTNDSCDPVLGVVHDANSAPCDDGDLCTLGDACANFECVPGDGALACSDGDPCTDDTCEAAVGCVFPQNSEPCDDASVCSLDDTCTSGLCLGTPKVCDDGNVCTLDACDPVTGCFSTVIVSNECRPIITILQPLRAATINGAAGAAVLITGSVVSGAGAIVDFTIDDGDNITLEPDGSFELLYTVPNGGTTVQFDATDALGNTRERVQSWLYSDQYRKPTQPKNGMIKHGMGVWLSAAALNDLSGLLESVVADIDIASGIPSPVADTSTHKVYLDNVTYGNPTITMAPTTGGMNLTVVIKNLKGDIDADGKKFCLIPNPFGGGCATEASYPGASGTMTINTITVTAFIEVTVNNDHELDAKVKDVNVSMSDPDIDVDSVLSFIVNPIINLIVPLFKSNIEDAFEGSLGSAIEPLVAEALGGLAFDFGFDLPPMDPAGDPIALSLKTDFQSMTFSPAGAAVVLRVGAYSDVDDPEYVNSGLPLRRGCNGTAHNLVLPGDAEMEITLPDDTINALLYAGWRGRLLEFDAPPSLLGGDAVADLGITNLVVHVSGMLAPTVSDCESGELKVHIGDLKVNADLELFGVPMTVEMFVGIVAGLGINITDGEIGFGLTEVEVVKIQTEILQPELVASEDTIAALIEAQLVPGLVEALGGGENLAGVPLPEIPVGDGAAIGISAQSLTRVDGNTVVAGQLQ